MKTNQEDGINYKTSLTDRHTHIKDQNHQRLWGPASSRGLIHATDLHLGEELCYIQAQLSMKSMKLWGFGPPPGTTKIAMEQNR